MKNALSLLLIIFLFTSCSSSNSSSNPIVVEKKDIVNLESFRGKRMILAIKNDVDNMLHDYVEEELVEGAFKIFERKRLNTVLNELGFQQSDIFDPDKTAKIGKQGGAQLAIVGTVKELPPGIDMGEEGFPFNWMVVLQIVDIERGQILLKKSFTDEDYEEYYKESGKYPLKCKGRTVKNNTSAYRLCSKNVAKWFAKHIVYTEEKTSKKE